MNPAPFDATSGWWSALRVTHRYLGMLICVPMLVWFLSGVVMMYVPYPRVGEQQRLRTLEPISWQACCRFAENVIDGNAFVVTARVENRAGQPALHVGTVDGRNVDVDLTKGTAIGTDAPRARTIALDVASRIIGPTVLVVDAEQIESDQWTIELAGQKPLFRFAFNDPKKTELYVSGMSGQVVLWTTATQRFWNWLGAIPHWLYFAPLRKHAALWSQSLIWAAVFGTFLTALGLYLGIAQIKSGRSSCRGWLYWHHIAGLLFGVATLAWVASGLISMNPWGLLAQRTDGAARQRLAGPLPQWRDVRASLENIRPRAEGLDAVSLVSTSFAEHLYWVAKRRDGTAIRLDAAGNAAVVSAAELADAARRVAGSADVLQASMLTEEDAYYVRNDDSFVLPVYRVILGDVDRTHHYIDPKTGALVQQLDRNARWYRWLFAWHRLDFASWIRARPLWDVVMLVLLAGGLSLVAAGAYLAATRCRNDVMCLLRRFTGDRT